MILADSNRILLRPIDKKDLQRTLGWRNDFSIAQMTLGYRFPITVDMEFNWYQQVVYDHSPQKIIFAIDLKSNNEIIGFTHLSKIDWISGTCYFGIVIGDVDNQNKGYGEETMHVLFRYVFNILNLRKVCIEVISYNQRAIDLYSKVGFANEGVLSKQIFFNSSYHDLHLMGLMKEDYIKISCTQNQH